MCKKSVLNKEKMIRIIYSWKVEPENIEQFIETWKKTTNSIHEEVEGAKGSFMLQNDNDNTEIKTIAKWDSLNDWKIFWPNNNPRQMQSMHDLGERVSAEIFKEVDGFIR